MEKITEKKNIILISIAVLTILVFLSLYIYNNFIFHIDIEGNSIIKLEYNFEYKEPGYRAFLYGEDLTDLVKIESNLENKKLGRYVIKYIVEKNGRKTTKERIVEVVDTTKPEIKLKGNEKVSLCSKEEYNDEGYTAFDNYDGDLTNKVKVTKDGNTIIYFVEDSNKNKAEIKREITKEDIEGPRIALVGGEQVYIRQFEAYKEPGYDAIDNCDGEISDKVKVEQNIDSSTLGLKEVLYSVIDSTGNETKAVRKVIVIDKNDKIPENTKGTIYLTFDDGPSSTITPKLLDILKEKGVKVTFFVIHHDNMEHIIKRAYDEGHVIALHSYTHNYRQIYSSDKAFFDDLKKISDEVEKITGEKSYITRFPGGSSNTVSRRYNQGIVTRVANKLLKDGYRYYDWNVSSGDAGGAKTKTAVYNNVIKGLSKKKNNVVLMHDFNKNYKTLDAISDIIDYGLKNGYEFKTIDKTTPMVRHRIAN